MDERVLKSIYDYWQSVYYTDTLAIICMSIALISAVKYYKNNKAGGYFIMLILCWLIDFTIILYLKKYFLIVEQNRWLSILIEEISNVVASVTEYYCFSYFIFKSLILFNNKKLFQFSAILFLLPVIFFFSETVRGFPIERIRHLSFVISSIEMCLLALQCLLYFYELFKRKVQEPLIERPSFWIVSALFIYRILVIPFFLVADKFIDINKTVLSIGFTIHLGSFCLLFGALIKVFGMNKSLTG
jgi:hypothetical protein